MKTLPALLCGVICLATSRNAWGAQPAPAPLDAAKVERITENLYKDHNKDKDVGLNADEFASVLAAWKRSLASNLGRARDKKAAADDRIEKLVPAVDKLVTEKGELVEGADPKLLLDAEGKLIADIDGDGKISLEEFRAFAVETLGGPAELVAAPKPGAPVPGAGLPAFGGGGPVFGGLGPAGGGGLRRDKDNDDDERERRKKLERDRDEARERQRDLERRLALQEKRDELLEQQLARERALAAERERELAELAKPKPALAAPVVVPIAPAVPTVPRVGPRPTAEGPQGGNAEPKRSVPAPAKQPAFEPKKESRPEPRREMKSEPKNEPRRESRPEPKKESKPEPRREMKPEPKREVKPEPKKETKSDPRKNDTGPGKRGAK